MSRSKTSKKPTTRARRRDGGRIWIRWEPSAVAHLFISAKFPKPGRGVVVRYLNRLVAKAGADEFSTLAKRLTAKEREEHGL